MRYITFLPPESAILANARQSHQFLSGHALLPDDAVVSSLSRRPVVIEVWTEKAINEVTVLACTS